MQKDDGMGRFWVHFKEITYYWKFRILNLGTFQNCKILETWTKMTFFIYCKKLVVNMNHEKKIVQKKVEMNE